MEAQVKKYTEQGYNLAITTPLKNGKVRIDAVRIDTVRKATVRSDRTVAQPAPAEAFDLSRPKPEQQAWSWKNLFGG